MEAHMKSKGHSVTAIIQRLNEEADTARRYLDICELEVLVPRLDGRFQPEAALRDHQQTHQPPDEAAGGCV